MSLKSLLSSLHTCVAFLMLTYSALVHLIMMYYIQVCYSWHKLWWEGYLAPAFTPSWNVYSERNSFQWQGILYASDDSTYKRQ